MKVDAVIEGDLRNLMGVIEKVDDSDVNTVRKVDHAYSLIS